MVMVLPFFHFLLLFVQLKTIEVSLISFCSYLPQTHVLPALKELSFYNLIASASLESASLLHESFSIGA